MNNIIAAMDNCFFDGQEVIAAVSGGADSMAMLHALLHCRRKLQITVAHVNHGLRGEKSRRDAEFVRAYCEENHLDCKIKEIPIAALAKKRRESVELCGRYERYRFFEEICPPQGVIATAHTLSDRIETLFLSLLRGCALEGLTSIPMQRGRIFRPLLRISRREIEAYCLENHISYMNDDSNTSCVYARNKIRLKAVPVFREINAGYEKNLLRFFDNIEKENDYLAAQAARCFKRLYHPFKGLYLQGMKELPEVIQKRVLVLFIKESQLPLDQKMILSLEEAIYTKKSRQVDKERFAVVEENYLFLKRKEREIPYFEYQIPLGEKKEFKDLQNLCIDYLKIGQIAEFSKNFSRNFISTLDCDKIKDTFIVRQRKPGDGLRLSKRPYKTLKKLMNEKKIAQVKRNALGVLCDASGVFWAQEIGADQRVLVSEKTERVMVLTWGKKE